MSSDKRALEKVLMCSYVLDLNSCQNECTSIMLITGVGGGSTFCNFTDAISGGQNAQE